MTDLVERLRATPVILRWFGDLGDQRIVSAHDLTEAAAEIEQLRKAMPDLMSVIGWLEAGCEPKHAATELRIYQGRIERALSKASGEGV